MSSTRISFQFLDDISSIAQRVGVLLGKQDSQELTQVQVFGIWRRHFGKWLVDVGSSLQQAVRVKLSVETWTNQIGVEELDSSLD